MKAIRHYSEHTYICTYVLTNIHLLYIVFRNRSIFAQQTVCRRKLKDIYAVLPNLFNCLSEEKFLCYHLFLKKVNLILVGYVPIYILVEARSQRRSTSE